MNNLLTQSSRNRSHDRSTCHSLCGKTPLVCSACLYMNRYLWRKFEGTFLLQGWMEMYIFKLDVTSNLQIPQTAALTAEYIMPCYKRSDWISHLFCYPWGLLQSPWGSNQYKHSDTLWKAPQGWMQGQGKEDILRSWPVGVVFTVISSFVLHWNQLQGRPRACKHNFKLKQQRKTWIVLTFHVVYRGFQVSIVKQKNEGHAGSKYQWQRASLGVTYRM